MTEKQFKCWYEGTDEEDDPVEITARSPEDAAVRFFDRDWEGGTEWGFVMIRDGEDVSRWKVTAETTTTFTARRAKGEGT